MHADVAVTEPLTKKKKLIENRPIWKLAMKENHNIKSRYTIGSSEL
jgi:hypothetical protein